MNVFCAHTFSVLNNKWWVFCFTKCLELHCLKRWTSSSFGPFSPPSQSDPPPSIYLVGQNGSSFFFSCIANFDSGKVWEWGLSYHNSRFITLITVTGSRIWITIIALFLTCAFTDVSSQSELLTKLNIIEEPMGWVYAALGTFMYNSSDKTSCQTFHGRNESHYGEL